MNTSTEQPFTHVPTNPNIPELEQKILQYWQDTEAFYASIDARPEKVEGENNEFVFYDGPPFANGLPHYGHLLTGFVKDAIPRYKTMRGKKSAMRRFGWDCHGLPAEMGAEKELGISGRGAIIEYGIDKFNSHCRESVMRYAHEWEYYVNRQARWVDFTNDYKTMDTPYMESVLWAFKQLYDKGLVYQEMRVMPYSWACETPLSNFETRLDNSYRERSDKAATVAFKLKEKITLKDNKAVEAEILAWTTTPWTLPSNLALAIGENINYVVVHKAGRYFVLAESSIEHYRHELTNEAGEVEVVSEIAARELAGHTYEPLFPYFSGHQNAFRILIGEFVLEGDGTGVVHMAPGFGEDDNILCQKHNIELVCPVDNAGRFTDEVPDFAGVQVFDTNDGIIKALKAAGRWIKTEMYVHNYPHCWRTDTPLIYKALPSWYVRVTEFKDRMVELNQQINWIPGHVRDGLFGKWLENARDWSISRNRFFGTPIPVWKSDDPAYPRIDVYGSIEELERDFGVKVTDLHRPYIDELVRPNPDDPTGKSMMRRVEDVFDCWFESGSMPFAQVHYPFENKEWFDTHFPADFIVEYVAQTRGWFYTLVVLATALFDRPPFLNCICHGVILDSEGQKLSKRLQNYVDPKDLFNTYGADALRWLMLSSPVMRGLELLIDKDGQMVHDVIRIVIKPIWNAYHFLTLYANVDNIRPTFDLSSKHLLDRYLIAKAKNLIEAVTAAMDNYDTSGACQLIVRFIEVLNNWYIRRSRPRFWQSEHDADKNGAYNTLYSVLITLTKLIAPLMPMISEAMYLGLTKPHNTSWKAEDSVHLTLYPDLNSWPSDDKLVEDMDKVQEICTAALSIRNQQNIRIRQPLGELKIIGAGLTHLSAYSDLIADELNVKHVSFIEDLSSYASFKLKINFPVLGKRLPQKVKDIIAAQKQDKWVQEGKGAIIVAGEELTPDEASLLLVPIDTTNSQSLPDQKAMVQLNLEITHELRAEGYARDIIRLVQQTRKDMGLNITDTIQLKVDNSHHLVEQLSAYHDMIASQTLAELLLVTQFPEEGPSLTITSIKLDEGDELRIAIKANK